MFVALRESSLTYCSCFCRCTVLLCSKACRYTMRLWSAYVSFPFICKNLVFYVKSPSAPLCMKCLPQEASELVISTLKSNFDEENCGVACGVPEVSPRPPLLEDMGRGAGPFTGAFEKSEGKSISRHGKAVVCPLLERASREQTYGVAKHGSGLTRAYGTMQWS